ncbi:hypothetical protein MUK60_10435 [Streptomyces sp. LRE541]|uniref:hypothetical protein n=1 Tax=Streptomyces sp. LRE541 TaxID=2931983 RepID=UPI00200BAA7C|nr:hypothetical protein [Streptomyces sp. LRE541]UPZ28196.1 hypothetical protein MUK60_10435 [Streptomyces sp. LRE541]
MAESVPVTCPACRREHVYAAPTYPCACGAPVTPALDSRAVPESVTHHTWDEGWVTIPCATCGRADQWPRPELGCPCGTVLRVPVAGTALDGDGPAGTAETEADSDGGSSDPEGAGAGSGEGGGRRPPPKSRPQRLPAAVSLPLPRSEPVPRPAFQPVTIRTARDAVTAAALYLRWLGYRDIRRADQRPPSGIGLAARGIVAQVDPTVRPASLRDVECLWLTAMTESSGCVYFSLAGYEEDARARADSLGVPLFVLDLTGTPQPANSLADELVATGA